MLAKNPFQPLLLNIKAASRKTGKRRVLHAHDYEMGHDISQCIIDFEKKLAVTVIDREL
jgi:hypothetical protein